MKLKTTSSTVFLATCIVGGVSSQRVLQDVVAVVGVRPTGASIVLSTSQADSTTTTIADEEELIKALEFDDHVTVVSPIVMGELLCDTLTDAEDAGSLSFVLPGDESITAEKSTYTVTDGGAFTDGIGRKVWTGTVTNPAQAVDEAVPRTVSMVWGDKCETETFLLKVTKRSVDGTTSILKSIPCYGSTTHVCLVEVAVEFDGPGEGISPTTATIAGGAISVDDVEGSGTEANPSADSSPSDRRLQDDGDTVIDVMVLYSSNSLVVFGGISADQMETNIVESIARTNQALINSKVALYLNAVHIGVLPYEHTSTITEDSLQELTFNEEVGNIRDAKGADLVQMIGQFNDGNCGRAFLYEGSNDVFATSVVGATCLDDNTVAHEYGHNLGCLHNREDASYPTDYAHGVRYCSGDDQYRTIMSYSCGSPYVNYFSNPEVEVLGKPTGTATENNARAIRDNMVEVSNYRDKVSESPTPAPAAGSPTTYRYMLMGCYGDSARDRVLTGDFTKGDGEMTTEVCAAFCEGSPYFGTEYGVECFCGVESDDPAELGGATCRYRCAGDSSQTCGGRNAISVYGYVETSGDPPEYLGCWTDAKTPGRIMDVMNTDSSMTNDVCEEICSSYSFYGTQYAQECWCGDASTDYTANGESDACNMPCTGDAGTVCGGRFAMSVWEYK